MFRIGDFSKLSLVTVKALRFYDEAGLLKPGQVDEFTGYRNYSANQLPRLNRVLALKDLGFSLEQIRRLLENELPVEQFKGMLLLRQEELREKLETDRAKLERVKNRLKQIEEENEMSRYDVLLKAVPPQLIASIRGVIPTYGDIGLFFEPLCGNVFKRNAKPAGPPLAIYYDKEYREHDVEVEVAVPLAAPLEEEGRIKVHELPGISQVACTVHHGPYEMLSQAYGELIKWIETNGYRIAGPNREIYLKGPEGKDSDPAEYVTEIQIPVEKV